MYLDYSKLMFDANGIPETPVLMLETMGGEVIGPLSNAINITFEVNFAELSEMSFELPAYSDGVKTPYYDDVSGHKVIRTDAYGVYLIMQPTTTGDGLEEYKQITAYSIEKELEFKRFFLEEGTFNFWNPVEPDDTIIGRALEVAPGWSVGSIDASLIGRYRTFDQYDEYLLDFLYGDAPEKFRCVIVFDPHSKTINAYDADAEVSSLPIYLGFDNLVESLEIEEMSDELVTAMRPYGADELDIRAVNPIGTNWIYDLSWFIANGDIPEALADKWETWQKAILNNQLYYKGLTSLQYSATAQSLALQAEMVDLEAELQDLTNQQSVTVQALAMEITESGKQYQQNLLNQINQQIAAKKNEIAAKQAEIDEINKNLDQSDPESYAGRILAVNEELAMKNFFAEEEIAILQKYFIEQDMTEETFVASDIDSSISGTSITLENESISVEGSAISMVEVEEFDRTMYVITGGKFTITGENNLSGDVIRGTLERHGASEFVLSLYAGSMKAGNSSAPSGMVTVSGSLSGFDSDIHAVTEQEITTYEGTEFSFSAGTASVYMTANVSDYQKFSVQMELFDYAVEVLSDVATPTYEFEVESGNFLFAQEFAPFRNSLALGKAIYLETYGGEVISPVLIGFEISVENREDLTLVFSNRFKRHDGVNTLKDMVETSYSSSRDFDASKYVYNQTVGQASMVSEFMNGSLNAAVNTIIGASNQSVIINGAGIHIGNDGQHQLRLVDTMLAFTDDNWSTAKIAIGKFASEEIGEYYGVNADVIGGKLMIGNTLIIENETDDGVMQFKVDSTGAWLNNSTFVMQSDNGNGRIIIDPKYGIVAGNGNLFTVDGTTVTPSFIDDDGSLVLDDVGMPEDANFFLDIRDGNAYFRGVMQATAGSIGGWTIEDDHLYSGSGSTYVALNGSNSWNANYAIWAGAENPNSAPFRVTRDGDLYASDGTFKGTISGARYEDSNGDNMMNGNEQFVSQYLDLKGITIRNSANQITFQVDSNGNTTIMGKVTMGSGSSINWAGITETNASSSQAYKLANTANTNANSAYNLAWNASNDADNANTLASSAYSAFQQITLTTGGRTYIDGSMIYTRSIYADALHLGGKLTIYSEYNGNTVGGYLGYATSNLDGSAGMQMTCGSSEVTVTRNGARMVVGSLSNTFYVADGTVGLRANGSAYVFSINSLSTEAQSDLGTPYGLWGQIYAVNTTISSSDRKVKTDIQYDMDPRYDDLWDRLKPCTGKFVNGTSGRTHMFLISQDVEEAIEDAGLTSLDFAAFIKSPVEKEDGTTEYVYGLRYEEFIPLMIHEMKKSEDEIKTLKEEVAALKAALNQN